MLAGNEAMTSVAYAVHDEIAEIRLQHPPVNALSEALLDELIASLDRAASDDAVRAVILSSGVAHRFSAGIDLKAAVAMAPAALHGLIHKLYVGLYEAQDRLGKPSIAAVNGTARGGGMTLAISCDLIVAARSATFGYPEIDVGVIPAIHFAHLPRIVGRYRAFELLFSGRTFPADEAAGIGLVNAVVDDDALLDEARALAATLAAKPPGVVRLGRAMFRKELDRDYRASIGTAVENFCTVAATDEAKEGMRGFVEKRSPRW